MGLLLVVLFIVVPIAELYVLIQIGQAIGVLPTIALLILDSVLGAALMRAQGRAAWMRFNRALAEGRVPGREVMDGALVIFGGALLLTPGFLSDILGLILLLPPTRAIVRTRARAPLRAAHRGGRGERGAGADGPAVHVPDRRWSGRSGRPPPTGIRRRRRRGHRERRAAAATRAAVTVGPLDEEPRAGDDPAFRDAVTFAFGDPAAKLYGLARVGAGGGGTSGFAIVYAGDQLVGATTQALARGRRRRGVLGVGDRGRRALRDRLAAGGLDRRLRRRGGEVRPALRGAVGPRGARARLAGGADRRHRGLRPGLHGDGHREPRRAHVRRALPGPARPSVGHARLGPDRAGAVAVGVDGAGEGRDADGGAPGEGQAPRRGGGRGLSRRPRRAARDLRPAAVDDVRRRAAPAPRGPGAVDVRGGRLRAPRGRRGRVRHDGRPRRPAAGQRVLRVAHGGPHRDRPLRRDAARQRR